MVVQVPGKEPRYCHDARAASEGVSLNSLLRTGPDLNNPLLKCICCVRRLPVVFFADVKGFYHQVRLKKEDRDAFRFYRWKPGTTDELQALCSTCTVFGAAPSASSATFAFRQNAEDHRDAYPPEVIESVNEAFYVDDCSDCAEDATAGIKLATGLISLCQEGGFELVKFVSNSRELLASIPEERRGPSVKSLKDALPTGKVLGVVYDAESDLFKVKVNFPTAGTRLITRREVLSAVMAIFDPLGMVGPFILTGKKFVQRLCSKKIGWDDPIATNIADEIDVWFQQIPLLDNISIPRWIGLTSKDQSVTLHTFSDASDTGYGAVTYAVVDDTLQVSWIHAKSRVSPIQETCVNVGGSTPRLELQAAVVGIDLVTFIRENMKLNISRSIYHTDSTCVYWQVQSDDKKFKVFVANRLNKIRLVCPKKNIRHVPSDLNPADVLSRGARPDEYEKWNLFHNGPEFLRQSEEFWPPLPQQCPEVIIGVLEVEQVVTPPGTEISTLLNNKSNFASAQRILCYVKRFITNCKNKVRSQGLTGQDISPPSALEFSDVNFAMVRDVQRRHFSKEIEFIRGWDRQPHRLKGVLCKASSSLRQLEPFIDVEGVLRVGGRLERSDEEWSVKHPIILPKFDSFTNHVICETHRQNAHAGVEFILSDLRRKYWILRGRETVKKVLWRCFECRRRWARPEQQRMSNLPAFRLQPAHPFCDTGVDLAGPFQVKSGRKGLKVWIVMMTCLRVRCLFGDIVEKIDVESFLGVLQRFHALYPGVHRFVSDNGTNLRGTAKLLTTMMRELQPETEEWMSSHHLKWDFIPAHAPHQGGIWERPIQTLKKTLNVLATQDLQKEQFRTILCVAVGIINRRPLTRVSSDPRDPRPLTPMDFLTPGVITSSTSVLPLTPLSGSSLRRSQDSLRPLVESLWKRWRKEYVASLQSRSKWLSRSRNLQNGDLVLLVDELAPREFWPLGVIVNVYPDDRGDVRRVIVRTAAGKELDRDVRKIVLLEREGEGEKAVETVEECQRTAGEETGHYRLRPRSKRT